MYNWVGVYGGKKLIMDWLLLRKLLLSSGVYGRVVFLFSGVEVFRMGGGGCGGLSGISVII